MYRFCVVSGLLLSCLFVTCIASPPLTFGQEEKVEKKEPVRRLPAYFKDIVTEVQKAKIYELQEQYSAKIDVLAEEIKKLQAERNAAIEALLNAEQKKKLADARAAASKSKENTAATIKANDEAKPEATTVEIKPDEGKKPATKK